MPMVSFFFFSPSDRFGCWSCQHNNFQAGRVFIHAWYTDIPAWDVSWILVGNVGKTVIQYGWSDLWTVEESFIIRALGKMCFTYWMDPLQTFVFLGFSRSFLRTITLRVIANVAPEHEFDLEKSTIRLYIWMMLILFSAWVIWLSNPTCMLHLIQKTLIERLRVFQKTTEINSPELIVESFNFINCQCWKLENFQHQSHQSNWKCMSCLFDQF